MNQELINKSTNQPINPKAIRERIPYRNEIFLLLLTFAISRLLLPLAGVDFDLSALYKNWQYLSTDTLQHNLLRGVFYDHTQPPLFNLLLGTVLKLTGSNAGITFTVLFKLITLVNTLLILSLLKKLIQHKYLPLIISLIYLINPASLIYENELFYTSFLSMMLLLCCHAIPRISERITWKNVAGFFLPLIVICLTRSIYHVLWLAVISSAAIIYYRRRAGVSRIVVCSLLSILIVGSWYVKNYIVFHKFSASTWTGMNMARNVFHDAIITDSSRIEAIEPFSKISLYRPFITPGNEIKYAGLNDTDLLMEMKNDSFINEKHIDYIQVSDLYTAACKREIKAHPAAYLKNVVQSSIAFFAPATRYPTTEFQARKIKYYDLIFSFNLSQLATGKQERRVALTLSAIPKAFMYFFVFFIILRDVIRQRRIGFLTLFIISTIIYIFTVSSLFEHYENMRFRYEIEPIFLILAAGILSNFIKKKSATLAP